MRFEMASVCCPLCKRELSKGSAGQAPVTRLCRQCQSLVLTAFRGPIQSAVPLVAVEPTPEVVFHPGSIEEYSLVSAAEFGDDNSTISNESSEHELRQLGPFETEDEMSLRFFEDEDKEYPLRRFESFEAPTNGHQSPPKAGVFAVSAPIKIAEPKPSLEVSPPVKTYVVAAEPVATDVSLPVVSDQAEDRYLERWLPAGEVAADPWQEPLPSWDYSQNEWPVLVGPSKLRVTRRPKTAITAIVVLLVLALSYFLIYRPANSERQADDLVAAGSAETHSSVNPANEPKNNPIPPAEDKAHSNATIPAASQQSGTLHENNNSLAKFSLQAAAFPTESGAQEFAEKLKHAGVPSYVVPAEVARRGRWFRVRVGRFNSADEAQRFAGEAQLRARTAGLTLQLIVCQYEQP